MFHDGKTVNYHTRQLSPKLRMLRYPITFRNNFCTQSQNTLHTQTLNSCNMSFLFCLTGLFGIWFFYGVTCLSSSLNAFQVQYMGSLHALQFISGEHSFSASLIIKSLLVVTCKYCKWCMHPAPQCPTGWTIQQTAIFVMLPKWKCMEHFISCTHTTLTSVEVQSFLERQVVLKVSLTNFRSRSHT